MWEIYDRAINKALVEMLVDRIVEACGKLPIKVKFEFITSTVKALKAKEIKAKYFKKELDENLSFFKDILSLTWMRQQIN